MCVTTASRPPPRVVALIVAVAVFLGFGVLYIYTDRIPTLWAWPVKPSATALLMGSGYMAGCYFFVRVMFARTWHSVSLGFIPVTVFASAMLVATALHWDRFNHSHIAFQLWVVLYVAAPFLFPALWLHNRRRDPGPAADTLMLPRALRVVTMVLGVLQLLFVLWMFVQPATVIPWWPWKLTPLTARTVASFYSLTAVIAIAVAVDGRWGAARNPLQSALVGVGLMALALPRVQADFDLANPLTWTFAAAMSLLIIGLSALLLFMRWREHGQTLSLQPRVAR